MKRYMNSSRLAEHDNGAWVKWEDYEELYKAISSGCNHIEKLLSENETLKEKLHPFDKNGQFKEPLDFRKLHFEQKDTTAAND